MSELSDQRYFNPDIESVEEFLQRFKVQNATKLSALTKDDGKLKAMYLANCLPVSILTDVQRRLKPTKLEDATYKQMEEHLIASYGVKKSVIGAAVTFFTRKQKDGETIVTYSKILNELASHCDYSECWRDRLLRDAFVSGLKNSRIIQSLITEGTSLKFSDCVEKARMFEQVLPEVKEISPRDTPKNLESSFKVRVEPKSKPVKTSSSPKGRPNRSTFPPGYVCIRCGQKAAHRADQCYALKLKCHTCHTAGHLSKVCKSKVPRKSNYLHSEEVDNTDYVFVKTVNNDDSFLGMW